MAFFDASQDCRFDVIVRQKDDRPRGLLYPRANRGKFHHARFVPPLEWTAFVEHLWTVSWHLPTDEELIQETLPHPSVHIVFESGSSRLVGVMQGRFRRRLRGKGRVFGVKFHPGGFCPFLGTNDGTQSFESLGEFVDRDIPLSEFFRSSADLGLLENQISQSEDDESLAKKVLCFLEPYRPDPDPTIETVRDFVRRIQTSPDLAQVSQLLENQEVSTRKLQRLFQQYVGLPPKWLIQRRRLHDAIEKMDEPSMTNFSKLAQELGYSDQAHFIRDFKKVVGSTPGEYLKKNSLNDEQQK